MWKVVLLLSVVGCWADDVTDGTTLVQTFLIHRHGDRTPTEQTILLSTDYAATLAATEKYGYGQLSNLGKQRSYKLGRYLRERYSPLLSSTYNKSSIYLRSSDSTRTKMTCLTAMAALFPAGEDNWSSELPWTPVPYTTVPIKYDFNMAYLNCPTYSNEFLTLLYSNPSRMEKYSDIMEVLANVTGTSALTSMPVLTYSFYDAFVSQRNLGVPLSDEIVAIMPELKEAAGVAMDIFIDEDQAKLYAGVLLNEFFTYATSIIAGDDTPAVRIYSLHDVNVFALMAVSKVPRQGVPEYTSSFALELRKVDETGQYVVLPVFKPDPSAETVYLQVEGCSLLCDLEQFQELVADSLLDVDTWRTDCGFSEDLVIDESSVA